MIQEREFETENAADACKKDQAVIACKSFEELTSRELYAIMKMRQDVFILEQECLYPDLDNRDFECFHLFAKKGDQIIAVNRIYQDDSDPETAHIGRVISLERKSGLGSKMMKQAEKEILHRYGIKRITLEGQTQAKGFYEKEGYRVISDPFLDAGIEHVVMEKILDF